MSDRQLGGGWRLVRTLRQFRHSQVRDQRDRPSVRHDPARAISSSWQMQPGLVASDLWWGFFIVGGVVSYVSDIDSTSSAALVVATVGFLLYTIAGVFAAMTVLTIGRRLQPDPISAFGSPAP